MKTAMQELIDEIKEAVPYFKMDIYQENFNKALEKEKEQIIDAFNEGIDEMAFATSGINYYNQTYNQNK
jgi:cation transport regulator ChaB